MTDHFQALKIEAKNPILDKLAQLGHLPQKTTPETFRKTISKRARAKTITVQLSLALANNNPSSILNKSYWNTFYCANAMTIEKGNVTCKYCKNRWCLVCNRVRTATNIRTYYNVLNKFEKPYFVTLTIPNVQGENLPSTIDGMLGNFREIIHSRTLRGLGAKGVRKLECTYNLGRNDYHPHMHIVVDGFQQAEAIKKKWLGLYPGALEYLQDIRQCNEGSLMELFKYFTKIVSKVGKGEIAVYTNALDTIFRAMKGRRTYQGFGIKRDKIEDDYTVIDERFIDDEISTWVFEQDCSDWINIVSGEKYTDYIPSKFDMNFINSIK